MTDKEQIIIDETECKDYDNGCCKGSCCLNSVSIVNSCEPQNTRCDFYVNKLEEQLALKTQECEELKEILNNPEHRVALTDVRTGEREVWRKLGGKADRYRKALEEIEGLVKNFCKDCDDYENCNWDKEGCYYSLIPNLKDIINKAKGERNAV